MSRKRKLWSKSVGPKGATVRVYERTPGGVLYAAAWDPHLGANGGMRKRSLKHKDKEKALAYATKESAKLQEGIEDFRRGRATLANVFVAYKRYRTPRKSESEQKADARRIELWTRYLGGEKDPLKISMGEWERFIDLRRSGEIDSRGNVMLEEERRPVGARTAEADLQWLRYVLGWAAKWRGTDGNYLLRENPVRGFEIPTEKNPNRPVATQDRFEAVREAAERLTVSVRKDGKVHQEVTYLPELLDIVNGTGRRISAVCQLRFEDLELDSGPYGAIVWPEDTDKEGKVWRCPIGPDVRAAIDRILAERPGIRSAPLFPAPGDPSKPMGRYLADRWLRAAEELAELEPQEGSLWHAYRRKWATERKHMPDVDVARTGGWSSLEALRASYQQADEATMLEVVMGGGQLREVQG